jgi:multicomponent Na+:H+ antiporter subunit G
MMAGIEMLSGALLLAGAALGVIGAIGLHRLPDFYTRAHAAGITDTLCAGLFLGGLALHFGGTLASAKLGLIFLFLLFTSPTACHALAKSALASGLHPWGAGAPPSATITSTAGKPPSIP